VLSAPPCSHLINHYLDNWYLTLILKALHTLIMIILFYFLIKLKKKSLIMPHIAVSIAYIMTHVDELKSCCSFIIVVSFLSSKGTSNFFFYKKCRTWANWKITTMSNAAQQFQWLDSRSNYGKLNYFLFSFLPTLLRTLSPFLCLYL
jgi:chromate transport protein ChrA